MDHHLTARRTVLKGAAGLGAGAAAITILGGCGRGSGTPDQGIDTEAVTAAVRQAVAAGQVAVGAAAFLEQARVIVTQPVPGSFVVFSDRCPHQGGRVSRLSDQGTLVCPLHGSEFDLGSGEHVAGPAAGGLDRYDIPVPAPAA